MFIHWIRRCIGSGRCGRHILDLIPFHVLRNGYVNGLLHDALGNDLLHRRVDDLFHSALLDVLLGLSLGVHAPSLVGAVVRRRHNGAPDSELLMLPERAQAAFSPTAGGASGVAVKGGD